MIRKHGEMTRFCSRYNVMQRKCEQNAGQCSPPKNHTTIDANIYMIDSPYLAEFILLFEYAQVVPFDRVANSKKNKRYANRTRHPIESQQITTNRY